MFSGKLCFKLIVCIILVGFVVATTAWSQTSGIWTNLELYGGHIYDIDIDPTNPNHLLVGCYMGGGLYASENGGINWKEVKAQLWFDDDDTFKDHSVYQVKRSTSNSQVVWVTHGVWAEVSIDGGRNWTHIFNHSMQRDCMGCSGEADTERKCEALAIDPTNADVVYVGTGGPQRTYGSGAVFKTTDRGRTWSKMNRGVDFDFPVVEIAIDPQNHNTIWLVTNAQGIEDRGGSLYRSTDSGDTWEMIFSLTFLGTGFSGVAVKPDDSNTVFTTSGLGVYRHSLDTSDPDNVRWVVEEAVEGSFIAATIEFDPQNPQTACTTWKHATFWGGDGLPKLSRSTDGGMTWETYSLETSGVNEFNTLAFHPTDRQILYAGDWNLGIFKSHDHGQTWTPINQGLNGVVVYDVATDPRDRTHLLAGTISAIYERRGSGDWQRRSDAQSPVVAFHPDDPATYFGVDFPYVIKSTDGGENWTKSNPLGGLDIFSLVVDRQQPDIIYASTNFDLYKSIDGGSTFTSILSPRNRKGESYPINAVAIDPQDNRHVFAGGGWFYAPGTIGDLWESWDGGVTWNRNGLSERDVIVNSLLIDPDDPLVITAGCGNSGGTDAPLYQSVDGGKAWKPVSNGIPPSIYNLKSLWGSGVGQLVAVGAADTARHYVGQDRMSIDLDTPLNLLGIWGPSSDHLFSVGENGIIQRYMQGNWSPMSSPTTNQLVGIWGVSESDIIAVGEKGTILQFNGQSWSAVEPMTTEWLAAIHGSSAAHRFAVGNNGTILRYDGSIWQATDSGTNQNLRGVWIGNFDFGFAVGEDGTIQRWDGTRWLPENSGTTESLFAVWGTGREHAYAAGSNGLLLSYDGNGWSKQISPTTHLINGLWIDAAGTLFVADNHGGLYQLADSKFTTIETPGSNNNSIVDIVQHPETTRAIYAATFGTGIFLSPNRGQDWLPLGIPDYFVFGIAAGSLYTATQGGLLQCSGTGVIAGNVSRSSSGEAIVRGKVYNDLGIKSLCVNGRYMMVSPAGVCSLIAIADGMANETINDVTVYGGDITWVDITMHRGIGYPVIDDGGTSATYHSDGGGAYCFVNTTNTANGIECSLFGVNIFLVGLVLLLSLIKHKF